VFPQNSHVEILTVIVLGGALVQWLVHEDGSLMHGN
jgi:hypothetical protein